MKKAEIQPSADRTDQRERRPTTTDTPNAIGFGDSRYEEAADQRQKDRQFQQGKCNSIITKSSTVSRCGATSSDSRDFLPLSQSVQALSQRSNCIKQRRNGSTIQLSSRNRDNLVPEKIDTCGFALRCSMSEANGAALGRVDCRSHFSSTR